MNVAPRLQNPQQRFGEFRDAKVLLVLGFVLEAILAKSGLVGIGFTTHMLLTGVLLCWLAFAGEVTQPRCSAGAWGIAWNRSARVRSWLTAMVVWGFASSAVQTSFLQANLIFCGLWGLNYFVCFRSIPRLLSGLAANERVNVMAAVLVLGIVGSVLHPAYYLGRFSGIFGNPSWSGAFFGFSVVLFSVLHITRPRHRNLWRVLLCVAAVLVIMTRTRGGILGALVGCAALVLDRTDVPRRFIARAAVASTIFVVFLVGFLLSQGKLGEATPKIAAYFRVEKGMESLQEARSMNQSQGYRNFLNNGMFGRGLLSKYGGKDSSFEILGIRIPRYDWTKDDDPLNAFLLINQQIGVPGMLFFVAVLASLWKAIGLLPHECRLACIGLFAFGVFKAAVAGSWFLSFGDSFERYSLVFFGMILHVHPHMQRAKMKVMRRGVLR